MPVKTLTRGDSRTLTVSNFRLSDGTPTWLLAGDVLRFTLKFDYADNDSQALFRKSTKTGGITFTAGPGGTAVINIVPADWVNVGLSRSTDCAADLELTRPSTGFVGTLWRQVVPVLPDASVTPA